MHSYTISLRTKKEKKEKCGLVGEHTYQQIPNPNPNPGTLCDKTRQFHGNDRNSSYLEMSAVHKNAFSETTFW